MESKIRWGVLGCARIADRAVIPGILAASNAELYALASTNPEKLLDFAHRHKPVKTYSSYEALLDDPMVDAVYIPMPNGLHYAWTLKALAKKKPVLCEKPLGINEDQVKEMFLMAKEHGVPLMEAFAYRHSPLTTTVKSLVASGEIGDLVFIDSHFSFFLDNGANVRLKSDLDGGATYDVGCYNLNIIRHLAGSEPSSIIATGEIGAESGVDEVSVAILTFPGGLRASSMSSFHCPQRSEYTVVGSQGIIRVPIGFNSKGSLEIFLEKDGKNRGIKIETPDNYMLEVEQFGRCLLSGEKPLISEEESLGNARTIDTILQQIRSISG